MKKFLFLISLFALPNILFALDEEYASLGNNPPVPARAVANPQAGGPHKRGSLGPTSTVNKRNPFDLNSDILENYKNWGKTRMNLEAAHKLGITGAGVTVMVIDSGVSPHKEFKTGAISTLDFTSSGPYDTFGHSTGVIGIIIAKGEDMLGVAPDAKIYSAKANPGQGLISSGPVVNAINWAVEHNKTSQDKISVINLSYGVSGWQQDLADAIKNAYKAGIIIVAPSGNEGFHKVLFPASMDEVIAVSGITAHDGAYGKSSYGAQVDFTAPASAVYTTGLNNSYIWADGTSVAAPYVAGMAALAIEGYRLANEGKDPSPAQVKEILAAASSLASGPHKLKQGYGVIDAGKVAARFVPAGKK
ncbi:Subtilisin-like serine protease [Elusimicrobium minutum Pei191]|uniref:Subtilisin-like serine protease n=1 Tax=Elusimicrobium minutum (strain Pei191) TaxID=445932 RepID=B2KC81_ELUMP|nr:S8 family serine peptidase [Elusimicrobium minutum]ACC98208.1 Subtilisin-like serine protease [Elusimicrobium minutum Pei191]